jgi:hypothetical protein
MYHCGRNSGTFTLSISESIPDVVNLQLQQRKISLSRHPTEYLQIKSTAECLASSELLTPHLLTARQVCTPRLFESSPRTKGGWYTLAGRLGGGG